MAYSDEFKKKNKALADQTIQSSEAVAQALEQAGQQQLAEMDTAQNERLKAQNAAQQLYQQRMNEGYTAFADIIADNNRRIAEADQEAQQRIAADQKAAKWTGATELAAAIANLVGVGAGNAVSQQYRSHTQDWIQKADADRREHQNRVDNLRDRQRALQQQLAQLKMGDAGQALQLARQQADQNYKDRMDRSQVATNTILQPAQQRAQGAVQAATVENQGALQGAQLDLQRRSQDLQAARSSGSGSRSSSSGSGNRYNVQFDGQDVTLNITKESREQAVRDGKEELLKDIMEMAGYKGDLESFIRETKNATTRENYTNDKGKTKTRKVDNPNAQYRDIVSAIVDGGDDADATINQFYELHRSQMNNVNRRLARVANGAVSFGETEDREESTGQTQSGEKQPANNGVMSGNDFVSRFSAPAAYGQSGDAVVSRFATPKQDQAAPAATPSAPVAQPQSQAVAQADTQDRPWYWNEKLEAKGSISKPIFQRVAKPIVEQGVDSAIERYNATKDNPTDRISSSDGNALKTMVKQRVEKGQKLSEIVKEASWIPDDLINYLAEEDLSALQAVMDERKSLSGNEFMQKYVWKGSQPSYRDMYAQLSE